MSLTLIPLGTLPDSPKPSRLSSPATSK